MRRCFDFGWRFALALALLGTGSAHANSVGMPVSAVVPSKNVCKFSTSSLALPFGTVDQLGAAPLVVPVTIDFVCNGASATAIYSVTASDGAQASGPGLRRMANGTGSFLPYDLTLTPSAGTVSKGTPVTVTVTGTLQPANYQNAPVGVYQDTVVLTVAP
jgi:spore coat protein U-like protein